MSKAARRERKARMAKVTFVPRNVRAVMGRVWRSQRIAQTVNPATGETIVRAIRSRPTVTRAFNTTQEQARRLKQWSRREAEIAGFAAA